MLTETGIFTPQCRLEPYWWRAAPRENEPQGTLPKSVDVAIIGAGITGLTTALHLVEAGRSVAVLDASEPGHGASTRNAGYVGRTLKHTFGELIEAHGLSHAVNVYREMMQAFLSVKEAVEKWRIDCCYRRQGRFLMATSPLMY